MEIQEYNVYFYIDTVKLLRMSFEKKNHMQKFVKINDLYFMINCWYYLFVLVGRRGN